MKSGSKLFVTIIALAVATGFTMTGCPEPEPSVSRYLSGTISISPSVDVTPGTELTANYTGNEIVSYQWKRDGYDVDTHIVYTPNDIGNYTVTVTAEGYGSKTSIPVVVTDPDTDHGGGPGHFHNWSEWLETTYPGTEERVCGADASHIEHRVTGIERPDIERFSFVAATSYTYRVTSVSTSGDVLIPAYYRWDEGSEFFPVTEIGNNAFSDSGITGVTIPARITYIGSGAFTGENITQLTADDGNFRYASQNGILYNKAKTLFISIPRSIGGNVTIPEGITAIGDSAFLNRTRLTGVFFVEGSLLETIGSNAFQNTTFTGITIPAGVRSIGDEAFSGSGLQSFNIEGDNQLGVPSSSQLASIGDSAFSGSTRLTSITIPESVTSIGSSAFSGCTSITGITIPNSVTSIADATFSNCTSLASITIPASVTSIGSSAFSGCTSITGITIPNGVTVISEAVFSNCTNLAHINISESVTSIGNSAFSGCTSLTSIEIAENIITIGTNAFPDTITSIVINTDKVTTTQTSNWGTIFTADNLSVAFNKAVGDYAFYGCTRLTSVYFGAGVTSIGDNAFSGSGITGVTIPTSVTSIGISAFSGCSRLSSITIPENVTSIGANAFPATITSIVIDTDKVTNTQTSNWGTIFSADNLSVTFNKAVGNNAFYGCTRLTSVYFGAGVTSIGNSAFYGCSGIVNYNMSIPESVISIGSNAFYNCSGINGSFTIPASVTSIGGSAFSGTGICSIYVSDNNSTFASQDGIMYNKAKTEIIAVPSSISGNVTIPAGVTSISDNAFFGCTGLYSITIPASVTFIGDNAFSGCSGLTSISIPENVTFIGANAFLGCSSLTSITINTNNVMTSQTSNWGTMFTANNLSVTFTKAVGEYAFYGCTRLISVSLETGVTSIGDSAFSGCTGLYSINIPATVMFIGNSAFSGWIASQYIYANRSDESAADSAWGAGWRTGCNATIVY